MCTKTFSGILTLYLTTGSLYFHVIVKYRGGHRGVAGGHSPPPDRFREGRSPTPEISRQKMFPI